MFIFDHHLPCPGIPDAILSTRRISIDFHFAMESAILSSALPFTPPRMVNNSTRTSLLQDTPWSRGSGSHSEFHNRHTQDNYKPYPKEDLKCNKATVTFDEFLKDILRVSPEWSHQEKSTIHNIVNLKRYKDMLELYTSQIHHKTERYHPLSCKIYLHPESVGSPNRTNLWLFVSV